jgi:tetratricopeptide (TPR) repeat protein
MFGSTYLVLVEPNKAEEHLVDAQKIYRDHYGKTDQNTLGARWLLGWVYIDQGRYYDAKDLLTEVLRNSRRMYGIEQQLDIKSGLALTYYYLGMYEQAESMYDEILQADQSSGGKAILSSHSLCSYRCDLARVYAAQGRYKEAERLLRKTLAAAEWEAESRWRLLYKKTMGDICRNQGLYEDANRLLVEALKKAQNTLGSEHMGTVGIMYSLAQLRTDQGNYEDANDLLDQVLAIGHRRLRDNHPAMLEFVNGLAVLRTKQKQYNEAESLFDEALTGRKHVLQEDHPGTLESKNDLAVLYKEQGLYEKAEPLLHEAVEGRIQKLGLQHPDTKASLKNLIELYEAQDKPELAEQLRTKLSNAEAAEE